MKQQLFSHIAKYWNIHLDASMGDSYLCSLACLLPHETSGRFGYFSSYSALDSLESKGGIWFRKESEFYTEISGDEMVAGLNSGQVGVFLTESNIAKELRKSTISQISAFALGEKQLHLKHAKNVLSELALQMVQEPLKVNDDLLSHLREIWTKDLSLAIDVNTELSRGADRQRYVDPKFLKKAELCLKELSDLLATAGIRSNKLLVI